MSIPASSRIASAIVTFFPDDGFPGRLAAIARESNPVIVVDNSANESARVALRVACAAQGATLIENAENVGIGRALNQAFAALRPDGLEWAIAFDQDSTPEPGFAAALLAARHGRGRPAAIVGANWRDEARPDAPSRHLRRSRALPWVFQRLVADEDLHDVTCVITSGTLFHLPTLRQLGPFDEGLFLDLVDTDLCLRARRAGHPISVAAGARLRHRRGAKRASHFAGRLWWPAFMPPSRLYLLFRNRLLLFRRHGIQFPHWVCFELAYAAKVLAEIACFEDDKLGKFSACVRGTWDGLLGRSGPPRLFFSPARCDRNHDRTAAPPPPRSLT